LSKSEAVTFYSFVNVEIYNYTRYNSFLFYYGTRTVYLQ